MRFWPETLIGRLSFWAFMLFLVSIPILWLAFLSGAARISENVVDTQILEFANQLRGYRAAAVAAARIGEESETTLTISMPVLVGDTDWVWQFSSDGKVEARSDLLELSEFVLASELAAETQSFVLTNIATSVGAIRIAARAVNEAPVGAKPNIVHYIVGLSEERYQGLVNDHRERLQDLVFIGVLPISIGILGMLALVVLTLRAAFKKLENAIEKYENTGGADIKGDFPREIQSLVDRANDILRQNEVLIDRTRKYVSKIAHDINHPLAILKNAVRNGVNADQANRQIERMSGLIDRYASLARTIGPEVQIRGAVEINNILADVAEGFQILYRRTPLEIGYDCRNDLKAVIPQHDMESILSNLVSNAHKFAQSKVLIIADVEDGRLLFSVEDDGPGIPEAERDGALNWGKRLDEAPPGTGFGLSIVCDIANIYAGSVVLGQSERLGGLKVTVRLPVHASFENLSPP